MSEVSSPDEWQQPAGAESVAPAAAPAPQEMQIAGSHPPAAAAAASNQVQTSDVRSGQVLPPQRPSRRRIVLPLVILAALGGAAWYGYDWYTVGRFLVTTDDAYVKADMATVATKISGYVAHVNVTDNQHVKAGDVLVQIDDGDYKLAVDAVRRKIDTANATVARVAQQAQAQNAVIAQAKAQLVSMQADATRTAADYDRAARLQQSSFGTQQNLDLARADRDKAVASVANAQASIDAAVADLAVLQAQKVEAERTADELQNSLAQAQRDLSFTDIRAPFDGVVGNKAVQQGDFVQPGTALMALVPLSSVYVEANFKETQLADVKPGQRVTFDVDALPGHEYTGTVESLAPASGSEFSLLPPDNATGNFTKIVQRIPVRIKVPAALAESGDLRPGLSVVVAVHTRNDSNGSLLAADAAEAPAQR